MRDISYQKIIKELIEKLCTYDIGKYFASQLSEKTDIVDSEEIDSLDTMDYILFIEETYNVKIEDDQIEKGGLLIIGETAKYILSCHGM